VKRLQENNINVLLHTEIVRFTKLGDSICTTKLGSALHYAP